MKLTLVTKYLTPHGPIEFVPVSDCPGYSHRIAFCGKLLQLWVPDATKPSRSTAVFFVRVACALRDGLPKYHYADQKVDPPLPAQATAV